MKLQDIDIVNHIIRYCDEILDARNRFGDTLDSLKADKHYLNSVSMCILQIGELYADIRLLWRRKPISLDLLIGRSSVFNHRKTGPTLERVIAQKGTMLYEA